MLDGCLGRDNGESTAINRKTYLTASSIPPISFPMTITTHKSLRSRLSTNARGSVNSPKSSDSMSSGFRLGDPDGLGVGDGVGIPKTVTLS